MYLSLSLFFCYVVSLIQIKFNGNRSWFVLVFLSSLLEPNCLKENNGIPEPNISKTVQFSDDSQEEIYQRDTPAEFIPPVPNPILFSIPMRTSNPEPPDAEDAVWVSVDGYDAGYLYAVSMGDPKQLDDMDEDDQAVIVLPHIMDVAATCAIKE